MQSLVVFILSLSVHEYAHARVAFALGDDTAARQGRLTLNPFAHIDPIGTIVMPILGAMASGISVIGWAKPVPVTPHRLSRRFSMRTGMMFVSVAGPASNVALAVLCLALFWLLFASGFVPAFSYDRPVSAFLFNMIAANVGLAIFNLLPIPPLDGHRLLPRSMDGVVEFLGRYSFVFFILIMFGGARYLSVPVTYVVNGLFALFGMPYDFFSFGR